MARMYTDVCVLWIFEIFRNKKSVTLNGYTYLNFCFLSFSKFILSLSFSLASSFFCLNK